MSKIVGIKNILKDKLGLPPKNKTATSFAPANIALCKYWGKRNQDLHLPVTDSLSISLGNKGSKTKVSLAKKDEIILNDNYVNAKESFYKRLFDFVDLFRANSECFKVEIICNIPIGAGLASSAAGFAALVLALDKLYGWELTKQELSVLARLGSGSAARSVFDGFVLWQKGDIDTGEDSFAIQLNNEWKNLCIGLLINSAETKPISSTEAMRITQETSDFYSLWPNKVAKDITQIKKAIDTKDFNMFGEIAEHNATTMHALMLTAKPIIDYMTVDTACDIQAVRFCRRKLNLPVYYTQDAGPNLKLLFQEEFASKIKAQFPQMEIIRPFCVQEEKIKEFA